MTEHEHDDDTQPEKLADQLDDDADEMQQRSDDLDSEIERTAKDWESKRRDPDEAGAPPPPDDAA